MLVGKKQKISKLYDKKNYSSTGEAAGAFALTANAATQVRDYLYKNLAILAILIPYTTMEEISL